MASWIVRASGESEDPAEHIKLLAGLRALLRRPEHGTGSSEFNSPHLAASNFHEPTDQEAAEATGSADPGAEGWQPGQPPGGVATPG